MDTLGMDKSEYIQRRRRRYLAQTLEVFDQKIAPHLPPEAAEEAENFKALVRQKLNALAVDSAEILDLQGELNGHAIDLRDRLYPNASPTRER